jgi:hypothetical protein
MYYLKEFPSHSNGALLNMLRKKNTDLMVFEQHYDNDNKQWRKRSQQQILQLKLSNYPLL